MASRSETIVTNIRAHTAEAIRKVVLNVHGELVIETPKDTGWASANWIPALDAPPPPEVNAPKVRPAQAQLGEAIVRAQIRYMNGLRDVLKMKAPRRVVLSNQVPYVMLLDSTRPSAQAAPGWIRRSIARGLAKSGVRGRVSGTNTVG